MKTPVVVTVLQNNVFKVLLVWLALAAVLLGRGSNGIAVYGGAAERAGLSPPLSSNAAADSSQLSDLPLPLQYAASRVLGRDQAAYHVAAEAGGFRAATPGQALTTDFGPEGIVLHLGQRLIGLTLQQIGYGEELRPVAAAELQVEGNRVEYQRGALTEWYLNGPLGLQQGFTLAAPPGPAGPGPLTLSLSLSGELAPVVDGDGRGLSLRAPEGTAVLRYGGLLAYDATGREVPARLELAEPAPALDRPTAGEAGDDQAAYTLQITVDDENAVYPLTIDPIVQLAKLLASDGTSLDRFGTSVAVSGDTVVIGENGFADGTGSAYVFVEPGGGWSGTLTETAKLLPSDLEIPDQDTGDLFGNSVAISGDTVVVGAPFDDDNDFRSGSAYVFVEPGGGWSGVLNETAKLLASDGASEDRFGESVAISGDTVVAGAGRHDSVSGSAYVFVEPGGGWSGTLNETAKLEASDGSVGDVLGESVAIDGNTVVAGAIGTDDLANNSGSVYVFVEPGGGWSGTQNETAKLLASDGAASDFFGESVAISGDTVVVGVPSDVDNGLGSGSAYVFVEPGGGWSGTQNETAKLLASDGAGGDLFGGSVAIGGDSVVVGATGDDDNGSFSGSAYIFVEPGGGWSGTVNETVKLLASDGTALSFFGSAVAISGDTVVVGAPFAPSGGAGYVFGPNELPLADAGGPYSGDEGSAIALNGAAASDPDFDALTLSWAVDAPAVCSFSDETILNPELTCADNGSYTVTLTADDGFTDPVNSEATVSVNNVAPAATFAASPDTIIQGGSATLSFADQSDAGSDDEAAGFTYSYDCTNDGTFELADSASATFDCAYPDAGLVTARGRIIDKDGGFTDYTANVTVLTPAEAIEELADTVEGFNLQHGLNNSLNAKLDAALNKLDDLNPNNDAAAINSLQAFINAVEAQRGKKLTNEQADILVAAAQAIIDSLL